jgi:predicted PolB exonuclease-like 3'-5' exonuclease
MLDHLNSDEIIFLDIETVPQVASFEELPDTLQHLWDKKSTTFRKPDENAADVFQRAGIYAEFGKIICISTGYLYLENNEQCLRLKTFFNHNEKELLMEFGQMVHTFSKKKNIQLCAHNGKEFDFPYIARRMLLNGVTLPKVLDIAGKKPWEVYFIDTMELWKFGDYKNYTSLELLATIFGIPTPKDDINGSQVAGVYWDEKDLERIVTYCEKDVLTIVQLFLKFKGDNLLKEKNILSVTTSQGAK